MYQTFIAPKSVHLLFFLVVGDDGCTSLVTRIAKNLGLLENASVAYIDDIPCWIIDYEYFNQAHMLKKGKDMKLVMMY
jgi:hypothetical protein